MQPSINSLSALKKPCRCRGTGNIVLCARRVQEVRITGLAEDLMYNRDIQTESVLPMRPAVRPSHRGPTALSNHQRCAHRISWEQNEIAAGGEYVHILDEIERRHPELTLMECRVCALTKEQIPTRQIAQTLGIAEKTVENHLRSARIKLGLKPGTKLSAVAEL